MAKSKFSNSIRKYIREEKARIRRREFDSKEQDRLIAELYARFSPKNPKEKSGEKSAQNSAEKKEPVAAKASEA